jgi:hypothetical protein
VKLTAVFEKVPEGYIGFVEGLPGANTQAPTLEEACENLSEAVGLVLSPSAAARSAAGNDGETRHRPMLSQRRQR